LKLKTKKSKELGRQASKLMPRGVTDSPFVARAKGSHIWDVDGNEYIDYKLGWGPVILGHAHPAVIKRVHEYSRKGLSYGLSSPMEIEVARKIKSLVPCAETVRYFVSGTEATMHAIRIARAYTKKDKVLKFEGHYHGSHDYVLFATEPETNAPPHPQPDSQGIPEPLKKLVIVNEWNDFDAVEKTVRKEADSIAAIITEPVMANAGVIPPMQGYLDFLKELCEKNNIALIFDEVKTGFRVAEGGAQQLLGVEPHIATFAKAMGNGYPISAVTGLEGVVGKYGTRDVIPQSTYARNLASLAAADATLEEIKKGHVHRRIQKFGNALIKGIQDILYDRKVDALVQGYPSLFQLYFTKRDRIRNYRDMLECDQELFAKLQSQMMKRGILLDEGNTEPFYTSAAHSKNDLRQTLEAFEASLRSAKAA
jgi:glutamate-1-semialdehyde 2,1-aminomutase